MISMPDSSTSFSSSSTMSAMPPPNSLRNSSWKYVRTAASVSVNSLDEYVRDLSKAIGTPYPPYEKIGVKVDGVYQQLNANILQIENEYYSYIRPKRIARSGERPTKALARAGVEYVEVRLMDLDPFHAIGITAATVRMLDVFLLHCALTPSPPDTTDHSVLEIAATAPASKFPPARTNEPSATSRSQILRMESAESPRPARM